MEGKILIYGFLTEDVQLIDGKNKNKDGRMVVAVNISKESTEYYTVFEYNISERRAKLLTKGTFVQVYGAISYNIYINPKIAEEIDGTKINEDPALFINDLKKYIHINKTIRAKDFEIIFSKN